MAVDNDEKIEEIREKLYDIHGSMKTIERHIESLESRIDKAEEDTDKNSRLIWIGMGGVGLLSLLGKYVIQILTAKGA